MIPAPPPVEPMPAPGQSWPQTPLAPHPKGTTVLVMGILGLVVFSPLAIVAWVMGNGVKRDMEASPGRYLPSSSATAGRILGIVGTIIFAVASVVVVILVATGNLPAK
ncbi:MAG: hypothetical protein FWG16_04500 [Micrococcales bacterium]|nr:hypothetical protein [Micrococcales bacterium]